VDWTNPLSSTFTGPTAIAIAEFAPAPGIPQLGSSALLDSLSPRLMMQLQYRNLNGVEYLWANHSVANGALVGVRWYEVQDPGGAPALVQQGTYTPDSHHRWMGSIAADQDGNMAVGYSVSSSAVSGIGTPPSGQARLRGCSPRACHTHSRHGFNQALAVGRLRWTRLINRRLYFLVHHGYYITTGSNWRPIGSFRFPPGSQRFLKGMCVILTLNLAEVMLSVFPYPNI
jgi:hypothetical protein